MSRLVKWIFGLPLAYLFYLAIGLLLPNIGPITNALRYALLSACVLYVGKFLLKFTIKDFVAQGRSFDIHLFLSGFLTMMIISAITTFIWFLFEKSSFSYSSRGFESFKSWIIQLPLLICAVFSEELIFRSYIAHVVKPEYETKLKNKLILSICSAFLFTIAHFANPEVSGSSAIWAMLFYFVFGFALMVITLETKGIEASCGIHFANNLFCAVFVSYENAVLETSSIFVNSNSIGPILIIQAVVCSLFCIWQLLYGFLHNKQ